MIVYMLKNKRTGQWYAHGNWVKQEKASIWTTKQGPTSAKSCFTLPNDHLEIVPFLLFPLEKPYEDRCIT